jgi:cytochrome d ubiquinol oxidase subunit I
VFKRRLPKSRMFLVVAAAAGVLSVVALEAGWVVTEVGRQPWIVRNLMKVEQAATGNTEVWITFVAVLLIYAVVGVTLVLVLRLMSRRWREGELDDRGGPYEPRGGVPPREPAGIS